MTTREQLSEDARQLATEASATSARRIATRDRVRHLINERDRLMAVVAQSTSDLDVIRGELDQAELEHDEAGRAEVQAHVCAGHVIQEAQAATA
jgi:hypothetical protein